MDETVPATASIDAYMKLGEIKGESTDDGHKEWIDVLAWSWGMSQSPSRMRPGVAPRGPLVVEDIIVKKNFDASTPIIFKNLATGEHTDEFILDVVKTVGSKSETFLQLKADNAGATSSQRTPV